MTPHWDRVFAAVTTLATWEFLRWAWRKTRALRGERIALRNETIGQIANLVESQQTDLRMANWIRGLRTPEK